MKIMILKIALTIYNKQWKKEASFYSKKCYGCPKTVTKEHNPKTCSSIRSFKVCNGKHVTILHDYLRKKTTINSDRGLTDDKKNEGVKCASVNTGRDVISTCVVPLKVQYGNSGKILEIQALLDSCS